MFVVTVLGFNKILTHKVVRILRCARRPFVRAVDGSRSIRRHGRNLWLDADCFQVQTRAKAVVFMTDPYLLVVANTLAGEVEIGM